MLVDVKLINPKGILAGITLCVHLAHMSYFNDLFAAFIAYKIFQLFKGEEKGQTSYDKLETAVPHVATDHDKCSAPHNESTAF